MPDDLLKDFITESSELVQQVEQDLLALEDHPDAEAVNRIFRGMHTIKGTSSFFGFEKLVELTHHAEDLMNQIRKGEFPVTREIIDALLRTNDQVRIMVSDVGTGVTRQYDLAPYLEALEACVPAAGAPQGVNPLAAAAPAQTDAAASNTPAAEAAPVPIADPAAAAAAAALAAEAAQEQSARALQSARPETSDTMRVEIRKLDYLVNLVGELVLERNRLLRLSQELAGAGLRDSSLSEAVATSTARLSFITDELQNASLCTRMVPIDNVFRKLPRLVRELSHQVGKEVEIVISGQETEIDKTMIEQIHDPLVHILRNSLDHGIEGAEKRAAAGKNPTGRITVDACQQGDQIVVTVNDDGGGINPEVIREKVVEKGIYSSEHAAQLSRRELLDALFLPGFSTAAKVNNLSGRGVGMDVVRTNLRRLNGSVEIESVLGKGTTITLRVPLTMAILPVLLVQVSDEIYAIPLRSVLETVRLDHEAVHHVEGNEVLVLRDRTVPLMRLAEVVGAPNAKPASRAVILSINESRVALAVEGLIGQESTVIKPLSALLRDSQYVAGATITGDGRVRLVLDPNHLLVTSGPAAYAMQ
ncbi:MAG: chemotaxis protein CheA [Acidobacteriota bacterium]|nr:chemotaxis protein CheA [Acidobacteriota bacterium]